MERTEKQNPSILIRTDGNPSIASGHLMRCLSIAQALREEGAAVTFAVADTVSSGLLASYAGASYPIHVLHTDYRKPKEELESLRAFELEKYDCLLIDSYFVTPEYLEALRPMIRTAYIDDLYSFDYPVDLVINYDFAPPKDFYANAGKLLAGCRYTPLRRQFYGITPRIRERAQSLLLSTGGTDDYNVAGQLLEALLSAPECADWQYHVLTGPMHRHRQRLEALAASHPQVILHEGVTQMASLMADCDLAVSAAGTTLYELCAAGLPSVSFTMADNQFATARDMERFASLPYAGDVRTDADFIPHTAACLIQMASDLLHRTRLSASMQAAVDGKGAERIAKELCALSGKICARQPEQYNSQTCAQ